VLSYPAAVDLSSHTLRYAADLLRRHRRVIGSRWRKLSCARQALLVLAQLRCGDTYARLAAGFRVGVATVYRYVTELVDLLLAAAPDLAAAVQTARGKAYVVLDGTLIAIDRVGMRAKTDRPYYSGKHKRHGLNVQVLSDPAGRLIWASPALPGSIHDLKAARRHGLIHALTGYDIPTLADRGYQRAAATIRVPLRGRDLPAGPTNVNTAHARLRAPGERGPATLKTWHLLRRLRCCPQRGTALLAAVLALETTTRT
jgi:DDE superfamily endonuclease/Helix-turn-helix of DDE superfamily endonuclease